MPWILVHGRTRATSEYEQEVQVREGYVPVDEGKIHYQVDGDGEHTIVWMHGLPLNGGAWYAQVEHFRSRFRNVTFDLRGYGRSSKLPGHVSDVTGLYVSDLRYLFALLALDKPTLVGHASGGHGALRFAAEAPDLLGKLVVINASPKFRVGDDWPFGFDQRGVDTFLQIIETQNLDAIAKALLDPALQDHGDAAQLEPLRKRFTAMAHEAGKETIKAFFTKISLDDDRDRLKEIRTPTLLLSSSLGKEVPPGVALYMRSQIASAQLLELPGADHFAFATQTTLVNRLIEQFIAPRCDVAPFSEAEHA